MQHNNPNLHGKTHPMGAAKLKAREEFLSKAKSLLENTGGYALLNDNYALIDTRIYVAKLKEDLRDVSTSQSA